jgi:hypothetical protein
MEYKIDGVSLKAVERNEMRGVHAAQYISAVLRSAAVIWYSPDRGGSGRVSPLPLSSCSTSPALNQRGSLPSRFSTLSSRAFGPRNLMKVAQSVFPIGCAGMEN